MGTNYYLSKDGPPPCPTCGHSMAKEERHHIGKSSSGWNFALHVMPGTRTLEAWERAWALPGYRIENEYGDTLTPEQMLKVIKDRPPARLGRPQQGDAYGGPTWDLVEGEFS